MAPPAATPVPPGIFRYRYAGWSQRDGTHSCGGEWSPMCFNTLQEITIYSSVSMRAFSIRDLWSHGTDWKVSGEQGIFSV